MSVTHNSQAEHRKRIDSKKHKMYNLKQGRSQKIFEGEYGGGGSHTFSKISV